MFNMLIVCGPDFFRDLVSLSLSSINDIICPLAYAVKPYNMEGKRKKELARDFNVQIFLSKTFDPKYVRGESPYEHSSAQNFVTKV